MNAPEYRFLTQWRVLGTVEEVAAVLADVRELARWWPVGLPRRRRARAGRRGRRRKARCGSTRRDGCRTRSTGSFAVTESRHPHGFTIEAEGDLAGRGEWTFEQAGAWTRVTYDWRVRAEKPLLRALSPLFARPLLAANHRWAMRKGEESLALELARRRASTPAERARIPAPPQPASPSPLVVIGAGAALGLAAYGLMRVVLQHRRCR